MSHKQGSVQRYLEQFHSFYKTQVTFWNNYLQGKKGFVSFLF